MAPAHLYFMISRSFFPSSLFFFLFQLLWMTTAESESFFLSVLLLVSQLLAHAWIKIEASCTMSAFIMKEGWW